MSAALADARTGGGARLRALLCAASLMACIGGGAMLAQGVSVPIRAQAAQVRLEREFEQRLAMAVPANSASRPAGAEHSLTRKTQTRQVARAGGPIARISVERLGVRDVVLASDGSHEQLALGPTMVKRGDAASPVTVLAAHRDTHFAFIRDLREGDLVTLQQVTGEVERYQVTRFETVRWNAFTYPRDPARPLLALTTCYPFGGTEYGGPWRRVAWAERVY